MSVASHIAAQRTEHKVPHAVSCRALGVSESWFYKWRDRPPTPRAQRRARLDAAVRDSFAESGRNPCTYGSPRVHADLLDVGWKVSVKTVAVSMVSQGLVARVKRRRRSLTRPDKAAVPFPDLVKRDFSAAAINEKWCGDLTEVPTDEGKLYLATVEDLASRRLPGFALGEHHDAELAAGALKMAAATRGGDVRGVVFHSDKGGEYTGDHFEATCVALGVTQSMGRVGSALDNAAAESSTRPSSGSCCPGGISRRSTRPAAKSPRSSTATTARVATARARCVPPSTTNSSSPPEPSARTSQHENTAAQIASEALERITWHQSAGNERLRPPIRNPP